MSEDAIVDVTNLSEEAQRVVLEKKVAGKRRLKEWYKFLAEMALYDEHTDELIRRTSKKATIFLVLTIITGFLAIPLMFFPLILFVPFLILTIVFYRKKKRLQSIDLSNDFRNVLIPFLEALAEDLDPKAEMDLTLDLAGPIESKIQSKKDLPPGRFKKLVQTEYLDPWCRLEAPLAAGGRLLLSIENHFVVQDRYWRNPRGKSKHKAKWKKRVTVTAGLRAEEGVLGFDDQEFKEAAAMEKMKLKTTGKGDVARIEKTFKFGNVGGPPDAAVRTEDLVEMFFQLSSTMKAAA